MARRQQKNETGITSIDGIQPHQVWISYTCIKCKTVNCVKVEGDLPTPKDAYKNMSLKCEKCKFIHAKQSPLPFKTWPDVARDEDSVLVQRFWEGFFRFLTEQPESYYKQCPKCGSILPFSAFSKHKGFGLLERQMECRACKGAINSCLNPLRTKEQLHESSVRRRIADLFVGSEKIDMNDLFKRFGGRCFKTKQVLDIEDRGSWAIDHILPSKYLYPLSITNAALLSKGANENKRDMWPSEFYTNTELIELAQITGASLELLSSATPIMNTELDVNGAVKKYLTVREDSDLPKRIAELKKMISGYKLDDLLSEENKKLLGIE